MVTLLTFLTPEDEWMGSLGDVNAENLTCCCWQLVKVFRANAFSPADRYLDLLFRFFTGVLCTGFLAVAFLAKHVVVDLLATDLFCISAKHRRFATGDKMSVEMADWRSFGFWRLFFTGFTLFETAASVDEFISTLASEQAFDWASLTSWARPKSTRLPLDTEKMY